MTFSRGTSICRRLVQLTTFSEHAPLVNARAASSAAPWSRNTAGRPSKKSSPGTKPTAAAAAAAQQSAEPEPHWKVHHRTMKRKYPQGFDPPSRLSREAMDIVRRLHASDPEKHSTPALAKQFKISAEGVRRILKSNWKPSPEKLDRERARGRAMAASAGAAPNSGAVRAQSAQDGMNEQDETQKLVEQWRARQTLPQ